MRQMENINAGFLGAGGIARSHAFALQALKYYYDQAPAVIFESVCSATAQKREKFAGQFGFAKAETEDQFFRNENINTVFILGPNQVHYEHLERALKMPGVRFIYLEKPVCASFEEEQAMWKLLDTIRAGVKVQVGFQFLQSTAVREALSFWKTGVLGKPIHFDLKYYHSDYLQLPYREKRKTRLAPAPEGGAMADLGSHGISLLLAFFGSRLQIVHAMQSGHFDDVPDSSDLFSSITLKDLNSCAAGHLSASRISSGTGDLVDLEIYAGRGALRYSTRTPDSFRFYLEETGQWVTRHVGSNYRPVGSFPSGHVSPGWLRALVHAHYLFLGGADEKAFIPDLKHGLEVQRLVRETAAHLAVYRNQGHGDGAK